MLEKLQNAAPASTQPATGAAAAAAAASHAPKQEPPQVLLPCCSSTPARVPDQPLYCTGWQTLLLLVLCCCCVLCYPRPVPVLY
jgi:hypothetical protein